MLNNSYLRLRGAPAAALLSVLAVLALSPVQTFAFPACESSEDCSDGNYCNGYEVCENGSCEEGPGPCNDTQTCNEDDDICEGGGPNPGHVANSCSADEPDSGDSSIDSLDQDFAPLSK